MSAIPPAARTQDERTSQAIELMARFAERTVGTSDGPQRRYLWTDAFAVCNFLGLRAATGNPLFTQDALALIDHVHHTLARHRPGERRGGSPWISGLEPAEGEAHPTRGGLRIGKPLDERRAGEPIDERLEWERDGQYFHYLTRWIHALDQAARCTGMSTFQVWARELADVAHRAFTYAPPGGTALRMHWKLSIDLSRPLVEAMGQHDPLDGLVTCVQLEATAGSSRGPRLAGAATDFAAMLHPTRLSSDDPLSLGGLLVDACRIEQLRQQGAGSLGSFLSDALLEGVLEGALSGLRSLGNRQDLAAPARHRLAFRELGLAIGLSAVDLLARDLDAARFTGSARARSALESLARHSHLREEIESFWLHPEHRQAAPWTQHADINDVMLATALLPDGFLRLRTTPLA